MAYVGAILLDIDVISPLQSPHHNDMYQVNQGKCLKDSVYVCVVMLGNLEFWDNRDRDSLMIIKLNLELIMSNTRTYINLAHIHTNTLPRIHMKDLCFHKIDIIFDQVICR